MFSFPQIVIDGEVLGGFRELVQADMSGKLEELAQAAASAPHRREPHASAAARVYRTMTAVTAAPATLRLAPRPPFDGAGVLRWLGRATGAGRRGAGGRRRTAARCGLPGGPAVVALAPRRDHVACRFGSTDEADLTAAGPAAAACSTSTPTRPPTTAVLAADPVLAPLVAAKPGPARAGTVDPAETAVRAVLGQQVSLAAARTLAGRLVAACGPPLPPPWRAH